MEHKKTAQKKQAFYVFSPDQLYWKRLVKPPGLSFTMLIFSLILTVFSLALVVYFLAKVGNFYLTLLIRRTYLVCEPNSNPQGPGAEEP